MTGIFNNTFTSKYDCSLTLLLICYLKAHSHVSGPKLATVFRTSDQAPSPLCVPILTLPSAKQVPLDHQMQFWDLVQRATSLRPSPFPSGLPLHLTSSALSIYLYPQLLWLVTFCCCCFLLFYFYLFQEIVITASLGGEAVFHLFQ